jgi:hypothetical protein
MVVFMMFSSKGRFLRPHTMKTIPAMKTDRSGKQCRGFFKLDSPAWPRLLTKPVRGVLIPPDDWRYLDFASPGRSNGQDREITFPITKIRRGREALRDGETRWAVPGVIEKEKAGRLLRDLVGCS